MAQPTRHETAPADLSMYFAVLWVVLLPPLCAAHELVTKPGLMEFVIVAVPCGLLGGLGLRRRGVRKQFVNGLVTCLALLSGFVLMVQRGTLLTTFSPDRWLESWADPEAIGYLLCGITWLTTWRSLALVTDLDLVLSVGFSLSLFALASIVVSEARVLAFLLPFSAASLYLVMRYRRRQLEQEADEVLGGTHALLRNDARTLTGLLTTVTLLAVLLSAAMSRVEAPSTWFEATGVRLAERLSHWLEQAASGGGAADVSWSMDVAGRSPGGGAAVVFEAVTDYPTRWRTRAYSTYDGRRWQDRDIGRGWMRQPTVGVYELTPAQPPPARLLKYKICGRCEFPVLPLPDHAARLSVCGTKVSRGVAGGVFVDPSLPARHSYDVVADSLPEPVQGALDEETRQHYLALPDELAPTLATLARQITAGAENPRDQMQRLAAWLGEHKAYTLHPAGIPAESETVAWFLFHMDAGWCRHFATALAVLGRTVGVPTRLITGYAAGETGDADNHYLIRERDAHAWVEAWIPGQGWLAYDATDYAQPVVTPLQALYQTLSTGWQQVRLALDRGRYLTLAALMALLLLGGGARGRHGAKPPTQPVRRPAGRQPVARLLGRFERVLRRGGWRREAVETPTTLAARAAADWPAGAELLRRSADLLATAWYGPRALTIDERRRLGKLLDELAAAVRRRRREGRRTSGSNDPGALAETPHEPAA